MRDIKQIWADNSLELVRGALYATHPDIPEPNIDRQTRSSYRDRGGWMESDPFKIIVVVEPYGIGEQILDPYDHDPSEERRLTRAVAHLKRNPFVQDAGWDSLNSAILYFWIEPRIVS